MFGNFKDNADRHTPRIERAILLIHHYGYSYNHHNIYIYIYTYVYIYIYTHDILRQCSMGGGRIIPTMRRADDVKACRQHFGGKAIKALVTCWI